MKLYQYITSSAICLGLFFSSCNDWLDVTPVDTRTSENFYQTPSQLEQAIIGIYNGLMPLSEYSWMMSEIRSDNVWVPYKLGKQRDYVDIACFNSNITTISTISNAWNDLYEIIARANLFLSKVDQVEFSADLDNVKKQFIGEAKFLRGLAYFELVRYFGRIPVVLEPISIEKAMTIKQSETVEVYENAIIPDLQDAINSLMNEPLNYAGKSASAGRATLSAAQSLLGRVYLTMAGFPIQDESKKDLAKELFKETITNFGPKTWMNGIKCGLAKTTINTIFLKFNTWPLMVMAIQWYQRPSHQFHQSIQLSNYWEILCTVKNH
jgi:hypothetical protein